MPKKHKVKLCKKTLKKKYPQKTNVGEEVVQFVSRLFIAFCFFLVIAIGVDIYHLTH